MKAKLCYYEGEPGGYALLLADHGSLADILVFPEDGSAHKYLNDVPWRAEGGGHTIRKER